MNESPAQILNDITIEKLRAERQSLFLQLPAKEKFEYLRSRAAKGRTKLDAHFADRLKR
jgi:hypothetical protein